MMILSMAIYMMIMKYMFVVSAVVAQLCDPGTAVVLRQSRQRAAKDETPQFRLGKKPGQRLLKGSIRGSLKGSTRGSFKGSIWGFQEAWPTAKVQILGFRAKGVQGVGVKGLGFCV